MKVSLYVRERGTRKQKKHNPKKIYPVNGSIIWVLPWHHVGDARRQESR